MSFLIRSVVSAVGLWVAAAMLNGITLAQDSSSTGKKIGTILLLGAIFGLINSILRPIVRALSLPLIIVTLGLFLIVINAAMLELLSWFAGKTHLPFHVDKFWWTAIFGSVIISVVTMIANALLPEDREVR